jgi:putative transposase
MRDYTSTSVEDLVRSELKLSLEEIARRGAQRMLKMALELEVEEYIAQFAKEGSKKRVVRNGYLPEREVQTGIGSIKVKKPRVVDRDKGERFNSCILPRYVRRAPSLDGLIPALYLHGISSSDFGDALAPILGEGVKGLSSTNILRLKEEWIKEYTEWSKRRLEGKRYVYIWADGVYFNVRLSKERPCLLVIIGAMSDGSKEVIALVDGQRESKIAWQELLLSLKSRGLTEAPELAIGDGALGFWAALREEFPQTRAQRCWVHKTANILDKMPKAVQRGAKQKIHEMYMAPTKKDALEAYAEFIRLYEAKYERACLCLQKDKETLFEFHDFPAMHWKHIRTTNPIESTFATMRHRTRQTKGCGSTSATLSMVYKLAMKAQRGWNKLRGHELIAKVIAGIKFIDGEEAIAA